MAAPRDRRRSFWTVCYDGTRALRPVPLEARDVPSAWRRAERECRGRSFALYNPERRRVRVGVAPPAPFVPELRTTAVALCPDGELLLTGHENGLLRAVDASSGKVRWERATGASRIDCLVLPARAPWIVVCSRAGEVWVLDRTSGDVMLHLADDDARALALAPDDHTLALAGSVVELWALPQGVRTASLDADIAAALHAARVENDEAGDALPEEDNVYAVGFACGGTRVVGARARRGGELVVWDPQSGRRLATRAGCPVNRMVLTRDGRQALLGIRDDGALVRHVDLDTLEVRNAYTTGAEGLWDLRVTPDDRFALVHDEETGVYVVDLTNGATHAWLDEFEACAYAVRPGNTNETRARKAANGEMKDDTHVVALPRWRRGDPGAPLSCDGRRYAALRRGHEQGMVALFDLNTCLPYAALAHTRPVVAVWLDSTGSRAATCDTDGSVFVWTIPDAPEQLQV